MKRIVQYRISSERILIVTEDEKSSFFYLQDLVYQLRLTQVRVCPSKRSTPLEVLKTAKRISEKDGNFDHVYIVIDRDTHEAFEEAKKTCIQWGFYWIPSYPCFEYWLLLHFRFSAKPYAMSHTSPCEQVISDLEKEMNGYQKNQKNLLKKTWANLEQAKINAARRFAETQAEYNPNPSTHFHLLVKALQNLAQ